MTTVELARSLLDKTESNLKRIDAFGDDFIAPSLNEWRYAVRRAKTMYRLTVCAAAATIAGFLFSLAVKFCRMLFS